MTMHFADTEIRAALDELSALPAAVSDWLVETGTDSTDQPAAWVWAILPDDTADFDSLIAIRDLVLAFARERSEFPLSVYVSFRTVEEMESLA